MKYWNNRLVHLSAHRLARFFMFTFSIVPLFVRDNRNSVVHKWTISRHRVWADDFSCRWSFGPCRCSPRAGMERSWRRRGLDGWTCAAPGCIWRENSISSLIWQEKVVLAALFAADFVTSRAQVNLLHCAVRNHFQLQASGKKFASLKTRNMEQQIMAFCARNGWNFVSVSGGGSNDSKMEKSSS